VSLIVGLGVALAAALAERPVAWEVALAVWAGSVAVAYPVAVWAGWASDWTVLAVLAAFRAVAGRRGGCA
jgi:hypothetical protein